MLASTSSGSRRPPPSLAETPGAPIETLIRTTCVGSNPRSRVTNATKLRSSSPAPVKRTTASAICATASPVCPRFVRRRPGPPPVAPCPAARARGRSTRDHATAGAVPNRRPTATERPAVNASADSSRATSARPGTPRGNRAGAARTIPAATAQPTAPPATLRSKLSVRSWRTTRPPPAPSAPRMASSRRRAMPRASSRPATLAQAIVVSQEHDRGRALLGVGRGEQPAEVRHGPKHGEVGRGHGRAREVAVRPAPYDGDARRGAELLERPGVGPQPAQLGVRERRRSRAVRPDLAQEHDRLRVGIRQRPEQQAVDRAEQGRVRTDAQREHEHHRARESRAAPQAAGGVAHVAPQVVEPPPAPDVAGALADRGPVPQISPGRQHGFGLGDAGVPLSLALQIQVQAKLFLDIPFRRAASQVRHEAIQPSWPLHRLHPPSRRLLEAQDLFNGLA